VNDGNELRLCFKDANEESASLIHEMLWNKLQSIFERGKYPQEMITLFDEVDAAWRQLLTPFVTHINRKQFLLHEIEMAKSAQLSNQDRLMPPQSGRGKCIYLAKDVPYKFELPCSLGPSGYHTEEGRTIDRMMAEV
jgi:hypothetical protein